jgi:hypothetical protein
VWGGGGGYAYRQGPLQGLAAGAMVGFSAGVMVGFCCLDPVADKALLLEPTEGRCVVGGLCVHAGAMAGLSCREHGKGLSAWTVCLTRHCCWAPQTAGGWCGCCLLRVWCSDPGGDCCGHLVHDCSACVRVSGPCAVALLVEFRPASTQPGFVRTL